MPQPLAGCVLKESARPRTVSVVEAGVVLAGVVVRAGVGVAGEPAGAWLRGFCCKGEVVWAPHLRTRPAKKGPRAKRAYRQHIVQDSTQ